MKHRSTFIIQHSSLVFALLAAVLMLAACTPEPVEVERDIVYTVDQTTTTVHLRTDAEFDALLEQFCDYVEGGSTVTFYNANRTTGSTHDSTHFSTTSRTEMKQWMRQMEDAGKTVTVTYDTASGTYNGMAYATAPQPQNNNWVDLGLPSGLLWAKCNVGATAPEDYGDYFAWGETQPKSEYTWHNYRHGIGYNHLNKYCNNSIYGHNGFTDTLTTLEPCDDAATANMENARTPTESEWNELINNCTGEWTTLNGVNGYRFTGSNGNSIFLPAAGGNECTPGGSGHYWSASIYLHCPYAAKAFIFYHSDNPTEEGSYIGFNDRANGLSVRAVRPRN
jgi:hypothetical protein